MFTANPTRQRRHMAALIDRILGDLTSPRILNRTSRSVYPPVTVAACAPTLQRIKAQLRDQNHDIPVTSLAELREFLTNGCDSPLCGRDPSSARWEAERLLSELVQTQHRGATITDRRPQPTPATALDTPLNA